MIFALRLDRDFLSHSFPPFAPLYYGINYMHQIVQRAINYRMGFPLKLDT
jgi:hypothetical protein